MADKKFKAKFKVGDKVVVNKRGREELTLDDVEINGRAGKIVEVHYTESAPGGQMVPIFYSTDGPDGHYGIWEKYLRLDRRKK